jgi:hypothetical protein
VNKYIWFCGEQLAVGVPKLIVKSTRISDAFQRLLLFQGL